MDHTNTGPRLDSETVERLVRTRTRRGEIRPQIGILYDNFGDFRSPTNRTRRWSSKRIGTATKKERRRILMHVGLELKALGYDIGYIYNLKDEHIHALVRAKVDAGLAVRTLRKYISALAMMMKCMGKDIPDNIALLPERMQRVPTHATYDKSWIGHGIRLAEVVAMVPRAVRWVADALRLQRHFGLRLTESLLIDIHESDRGAYLWIFRGTKGARMRFVPVETGEQRGLLAELKARHPAGQALIGPEHAVSLKKATRTYYGVVREEIGITRKAAEVTSHGLRAEYLCWQYERITGERAPVQGGRPVPRVLDRAARLTLAYLAGHGRARVASAYIGRVLFGYRPAPGGSEPRLRLTGELEFIVKQQARLFERHAARLEAAKRARAATRVRPAAAERSNRRGSPRRR